eukprot:m.76312 g.76312  ORF g.76312 m.76312 type:complete len:66 (-) comp14021_c0_seq1:3463-3660(-)
MTTTTIAALQMHNNHLKPFTKSALESLQRRGERHFRVNKKDTARNTRQHACYTSLVREASLARWI